jgi:predicted nucleic acid-binding protein
VNLLDTTVAIDHLRGHPSATRPIGSTVAAGEPLGASELVRYELVAGVRDGEWPSLERFFEALFWTPVTEDIARAAGAMAGRYGAAHSGIDDIDYLVAATSVILDAELLTTNVRRFPMLEGLTAPY